MDVLAEKMKELQNERTHFNNLAQQHLETLRDNLQSIQTIMNEIEGVGDFPTLKALGFQDVNRLEVSNTKHKGTAEEHLGRVEEVQWKIKDLGEAIVYHERHSCHHREEDDHTRRTSGGSRR